MAHAVPTQKQYMYSTSNHMRETDKKESPKLLNKTLHNKLKDFFRGLVCVRRVFGDLLPYLAVFGLGGNALG